MEQPPSSRRPPPVPRASSGGRRQMETSHRGSRDQGPASPVGSQPVSPRGSITGLASPGLLSPSSSQFGADGAARFQPSEISSNAVYGGGTKPDSLFDPFAGQLQLDESSLSGSEDRMVGRSNQTLSLEMGKDQLEGSVGTAGFNTPSAHSRVDLHPLSSASGSAGSFPSQSDSIKLSQSPGREMLPDLSALNPMTLGIPERKETLPKAESSDRIYRTESQWTLPLPKAISSDYLSWGRAATPVSSIISKAESEEVLAYTEVRHCPKSHDLNISSSSNSSSRSSKENLSMMSTSTFGSSQIKHSEAFRITVVTWNVGTAMPPNDVTSLLHLNTGDSNDTDMIAIGLQEVNSMINKRLKDALFTDQWSELFMEVLSPFNFVLVSTVRMQGVILMVFAKYFHLPFLHDIQTDCTRTGLGGYWGNKGGVSVRLSVFGHMICFLNCHLPAHMEKAEQRREDFTTILHLQTFEGPTASGILDHDLIFWFGDLNFRIESLDIRFVKYAIDNNILHQLWEKDQLNIAKSSWPILKGFQEGPLNFPPTFKFDIGTNTYDTSAKKRKPAWTDRILWKIKGSGSSSRPGRSSGGVLAVTQLCYCSHMEYTVSDHKPVVSIFAVQFASRVDVPLVEMQVEDEWTKPEQAVVRYKVASTFQRSSWDWIALYRVGFRHCKDYIAYVWAKQEDTESNIFQLMFPEESLPKGKGEYILGYYSNNYSCMVGMTEPFQISLPSSDQGNSSPDSSLPSSDDEDNSTLVLLRSKSRSPSPSKMSQRRSRSPSLALFQGLLLRASTSRSPSPQNRRSSATLKSETPSIQFPKSSSRRQSMSREPASDGGTQLQAPWHFDENPLVRAASPRNLGLLPAMRLDTLDQVMGRRRDSADQGPSSRRMSPTSPTSGLAALFGTSPQDRGPQGQNSQNGQNGQNSQSRDAGP